MSSHSTNIVSSYNRIDDNKPQVRFTGIRDTQIEQAFNAARNNGLFTDCTLEDMKFDTMNIGWEVQGTFKVASTISGISIKCK